jgi:hypothetical protein
LHNIENKSPDKRLPGPYKVLFKTPHTPHIVCVILIVVVLIAIVEVLFPRVVSIVLGRTPIVVGSETPTPLHKGVLINKEHSLFILFYCFSDSPFIVFKPSSLPTTVAVEIQATIINRHCANR